MIRIYCTKKELADLVRACYENRTGHDKCENCLFVCKCSAGFDPVNEEIMDQIEDICEVVG